MNTLKLTVYGPDHTPQLVMPLTPDIERKLNLQMTNGRTIRQIRGKRFTWDKLTPIEPVLIELPEFAAWAGTKEAPGEDPSTFTWSVDEEVDVESTLEFFLYSTGSSTLAIAARALIWLADGSVWLSRQSEKGSAVLKEKAAALR